MNAEQMLQREAAERKPANAPTLVPEEAKEAPLNKLVFNKKMNSACRDINAFSSFLCECLRRV